MKNLLYGPKTYLCGINAPGKNIETDLPRIAAYSALRTAENDRFREYLKQCGGARVDSLVQALNEQVSAQIDCTACGNCCKSLMIVVSDEEADVLSAHLGQERSEFDERYLEKGSQLMIINRMPCHFLNDNKCTVYENRFAGCREFPALHLPDFTKRLFTIFMHYDRCPIIFNVVEKLKESVGFESDQ